MEPFTEMNKKYCVELKQIQVPLFIKYLNKLEHTSKQYTATFDKDDKLFLSPWCNNFEVDYNGTKFIVIIKEEGKPISDPPKNFTRINVYNDDKDKLRDFLEVALNYDDDDENDKKIKIFSATTHGYWDSIHSIYTQNLDNIFVPPKIKEELVKTIDDFIENKQRYIDFGKNHKLCILLSGIMGSGKSSIVKAIAYKYKRKIYNVCFSKGLTDEKFISLTSSIHENSIMLIEDIDAFFVDRKAQDIHISFSALINIMDGLLSSGNGLIIFMTANNPDRLDSALIRPGRVDKIIKFDYPRRAELKEAFEKLTNCYDEYKFEEVYEKIKSVKMTMSAFTDFMFRHPSDYMENLEKLIEQVRIYNEVVNDKTDKLYS